MAKTNAVLLAAFMPVSTLLPFADEGVRNVAFARSAFEHVMTFEEGDVGRQLDSDRGLFADDAAFKAFRKAFASSGKRVASATTWDGTATETSVGVWTVRFPSRVTYGKGAQRVEQCLNATATVVSTDRGPALASLVSAGRPCR